MISIQQFIYNVILILACSYFIHLHPTNFNFNFAIQDKNNSFYIELGVSANNPTIPVFLFEGERGNHYIIITYEDYVSGPPAASKFSVPAICKQESTLLPKRDTPPARKFASLSTFEKLEKLSSELMD